MSIEIRNFAVTINPGSTPSAPVTVSLAMPARKPIAVRIRVPPGPRGAMGWSLAAAGTVILPWNAGAFMVQDDEITEWPLDGQISSGAWQLIGYNTGLLPHTVYLTFQLQPLGGTATGTNSFAFASITAG